MIPSQRHELGTCFKQTSFPVIQRVSSSIKSTVKFGSNWLKLLNDCQLKNYSDLKWIARYQYCMYWLLWEPYPLHLKASCHNLLKMKSKWPIQVWVLYNNHWATTSPTSWHWKWPKIVILNLSPPQTENNTFLQHVTLHFSITYAENKVSYVGNFLWLIIIPILITYLLKNIL